MGGSVPAAVLYMSMSHDGYIAGPNDDSSNPGGDGFDRLHEWFHFKPGVHLKPDEPFSDLRGEAGQLVAKMNTYGAIVAGRRTVEQVDHWSGDRRGVRIFVPSHRPPGPDVANYPLVTYVADGIKSAMAQAKATAGDRHVLVHGAYTAQKALEAGVQSISTTQLS
jgi:dihydrofolate reductase